MSGDVTVSRRAMLGWLLYDWANSAFALTVMTAFFPVFYKLFWTAGHESSFATITLNLGTAVGGLCIALLAPVVGAIADAGRSRKGFLVAFMVLGVAATAVLPWVPRGAWLAALSVFVAANIGFSCANLFYDSLLPCVASRDKMDIVSSAGYALGYVGCGVLYIVNLLMVTNPEWFGLADRAAATRVSFWSVSVWWALFAVPLILWVREPREGARRESVGVVVREGLRQLRATAVDIIGHRALWVFLLAYWFYIDGVDTFIRAAADLGLSIGLDSKGLMISLLVVQMTAFPFAYLFGLAATRFGTLRMILVGICINLFVVTVGPLYVHTPGQFMFFAGLSAVPLGALQALSRSYWARMIPANKAAEYFGFYNLLGKFSVVFGPATIAIVASMVRALGGDSAQAARFGCASMGIFFVAGGLLVYMAGRAAGGAIGQLAGATPDGERPHHPHD